MSDSSEAPWPNNPNAPKIPSWVHAEEKVYFSGSLIGAILYGIVIVLFFQCINALLDPVGRARGSIKWGLVAHTAATFTFVTIYIALNLNIQSLAFIDNREFAGTQVIPPGPAGYQWSILSKPVGIAPTPMLVLNNWLIDGLLLYRCYVVYAMDYWVIALPCMMYLACFATGILFIYQTTRPASATVALDEVVHFGAPYFSIAFALNILLTLMIITRLVLHQKNIRNAMGTTAGVSGLYKAAITILIESSALFAVTFLMYVGPWATKSPLQYIFLQILAQTQVIAPFLITLRVANQRSSKHDTSVSGNVGSIRFSGQGKPVVGGETPHPMNSIDAGEFGVGVETTIDLHRDRTISGSEGSFEA